MLGLQVVLDFRCCCCEREVGVTVRCEGKGLHQVPHAVAAVHIPCPHCGGINQVCFEPGGEVRDVRPCRVQSWSLEPSLN